MPKRHTAISIFCLHEKRVIRRSPGGQHEILSDHRHVNRADELRHTIRSVAGLDVGDPWELLIVDNKSTDHTRSTVEGEAAGFPGLLRYLYEGEQGKYAALNTGIRAAVGAYIAVTDDDSRVEPDWLRQAVAGLDRHGCGYVGGKVLPLWRGEPPKWLPNRGGFHWAVLGLQDHGPDALEFGVNNVPWPLGINIVAPRETYNRIALFDNQLGRTAGTLRNQAQREWHLRARAAGMRGFYVPEMVVHHVVERERLTKHYFRRWAYWHGISRAILFRKLGVDMEAPDESRLDFSRVPRIGGVPRYMYLTLMARMRQMMRAQLKRDRVAAFEHELWLCFFAGLARQRWAERHAPIGKTGEATAKFV